MYLLDVELKYIYQVTNSSVQSYYINHMSCNISIVYKKNTRSAFLKDFFGVLKHSEWFQNIGKILKNVNQ